MSDLYAEFEAIAASMADDFPTDMAELLPRWRIEFEKAEAELRESGDLSGIEPIGRLAWSRLPEAEKPAALDCLFYTYWAAAAAESDERERREQVQAGTRMLPGDWHQLRIDLMGNVSEPTVTVRRDELARAMAELERLQHALAYAQRGSNGEAS